MNLKFFGAAGFVTGSCHLLTVGKKKILIDCGMFQGAKQLTRKNYEPFQFNPKEIEAVLLTHAHIDHSGLLPKLCQKGFRGKIYCTRATKDLLAIMLEDSANIQEMETKWDNKWLKKKGMALRKPLYTKDDVKKCLSHVNGVDYDKLLKIVPGIEAVLRDAGHILGSAIVEVFAIEGNVEKTIVFSGDLGQKDAPIIKNPTVIDKADYVIMESTYGGRTHEKEKEKNAFLIKLIKEVCKNNGKLIIPSFALERSQELIYRLNHLVEGGHVPHIPVYLDSPLAVKATRVFMKHTECYDDETLALLAKGDDPFMFPHLKYIISVEESKKLNTDHEAGIIIASSGMCTGGRIKHHLKNHLSEKKNIVLFVGYQANGTLGRRIRDGAKHVRIYKQEIEVRAKIMSIGAFSSHADKPQLISWLKGFKTKPKIFLVHGEVEQAQTIAEGIRSQLGYTTHIARLHQQIKL